MNRGKAHFNKPQRVTFQQECILITISNFFIEPGPIVIFAGHFFVSLAEGPTLKLSDEALSRDLFPNDYHCLGDNENRPIKWMPLESIAQGQFSRASDVVSWLTPGVLLRFD